MQNELHMAYTERRSTGDVLQAAPRQAAPAPAPPLPLASPLRHHRLRLPCETRTYEITGLARPVDFYFNIDALRRHQLSEDQQRFPAAGAPAEQVAVRNLHYHQQPADGTPQLHSVEYRTPHRRIVEHHRTLFFNDGADNTPPTLPLPFGQLGPRGLKYEDYGLALTEALLTAVFGDKLDWVAEAAPPGTPGKTCRQLLIEPERSGYVPGDYKVQGSSQGLGDQPDHYWLRSGVAGFAADAHQHFYLPESYTDPFGNATTLSYDPLDLYVAESKDARDNTTTVARFDFRVLAPIELVDANGNHTEVAHDLLGMVVAMAVKGKQVQGTWQADHLDGFGFALRNPDPAQVTAFCSNRGFDTPQQQQARAWLGTATTRFVYHFGGPYGTDGRPLPSARMASACAIAREIHWVQPGGPNSPLQIALECSDGSGAVLMQKVQAEPDAATPNQRCWLVNGLTLVNNKGKPVKQYEPAFSDDFGCERPQANGVSTTIFYDAAGRVVRTEMPDGTFSRVEFSPWHSTSWDANDTVKGSRWYRERLSTTQASPEAKRAARLAAQHGETPAQILLDSLGREVISVAHNRTPDANGAWQSEKHVTFTKLDAEGKPLWIRDALGHLVMQYITPPRANNAAGEAMPRGAAPCYDMAGNLLFQHSMDAGPRWSLNDAAGKPLFGWDVYRAVDTAAATPQKRLYVSDYDALHRPTQQWLVMDADAPRLIEALDYCDTIAPRSAAGTLALAEAQRRNLIGQAVRHFDPSGLATVERVDLSGQPTHLTRRLVKVIEAQDNDPALDWNLANREQLLEPGATENFRQFTDYDALGRMSRLVNWHRPNINRVAVYVPRYNARGLLQSEQLHLRATLQVGANDALTINTSPVSSHNHEAISAIRYNAKGQKEWLELGNGTVTTYSYDPDTFRLTNLRTQRTAAPRGLQDLAYTYDPVGNITTLIDRAQETVYQNNVRIEPKHEYVYDALYRLVEATGRENAAAQGPPPADEGPWPKGSFPSATSVDNYIQSYRYDAVGNIQIMKHEREHGPGWTRRYAYAFEDPGQPASNRLWRTWKNGLVWDGTGADSVTYRYDSHGSMLNLNRVEVPPAQAEDWGHQIDWDWRDMIRRFDAIGGGMARYHYGIDKQRTRKHITGIGGGEVKDRLYLGGFELYRRRNASGAVVEEIETHHLFEGEQRVLLVDDVIATDRTHRNTNIPYRKQPILRYQYGNHLGSVSLELDEVAQIISYEDLHPYGTNAFRLLKAGTEAPAKRYRYTGMERDEESGLSYHGARYLIEATSRWISIDPSGISDGLNRYRYCRCNPISNADRLGLQTQGTVGTTSGIAASKTRKAADIGWRLGQMAQHPEQYPTITEETKSAMRAEMHALILDASRLERNVGERTAKAEFGLKVTLAAGGLAVSAPVVGAAGLASAFGVGFAFSTGRQGAQVLDNQRTSISWMDSLEDAGWAGAFSVVSKVPGSKYGFAGLGVASSARAFSEGNSFTGAFDAATSIYALRQDLFNFKLSASIEPQLGAPATQSVATFGMSIAVTSGKGSPSSPFNVLMTGQSSSLLSAWRTFVNRTLKGDAGSIHGEDQWRAGQTIITAKLELPGGGKVLVAAPNSSAGWRPGQRELAIRLGYSPIDPYSPGSEIHAEGNLKSAIGDRNSPYFGAKVQGWAISRGRTGSSVVCNEGCKIFTNQWGPQQR